MLFFNKIFFKLILNEKIVKNVINKNGSKYLW